MYASFESWYASWPRGHQSHDRMSLGQPLLMMVVAGVLGMQCLIFRLARDGLDTASPQLRQLGWA